MCCSLDNVQNEKPYPFFKTSIKSAELIKVAYNTFIGMKIVFANTMMEICHHTGANVDDVSDAMGLATDRLMSTKYLYGGMGDGGGCHRSCISSDGPQFA